MIKRVKHSLIYLLLLWMGILSIVQSRSDAAESPEYNMELLLELYVNGVSTQHVALVDYIAPFYYIDRSDLEQTPIPIDHWGDAGTKRMIALNELSEVSVKYDDELQRLYITVPANWLPMQAVGNQRRVTEAKSSFGAIINYDLYATRTQQNSGNLNTWTEIRLFGEKGSFSHSGVYRQSFGQNRQSDRYIRYDTYWQYSDQDKLYTLTVGDLITRPLTWSNAARLGGIQISHNFSLRPDLITYPLPQFQGEVGVPSSMSLLVNGVQQQQHQLSPGPFMINDVTHLSGAGNAVIVTTDALGRTVSIDVPFYVTSKLLKEGLMDYTISAGWLRQKYGERNFSYRGFALDASLRYGLNDHWTVELHSEMSEHVQVLGAGFVTNVGRLGVINAAYTTTHHSGRIGSQIYLGYDYNSEKFNLLASYIKRNQFYKDLTMVDTHFGANKESFQATVSYPTENYGGFSVGFFSNVNPQHQRTNMWSLGWNRSLNDYGSLFAYVNRSNDAKNRWSASLQWVMPLDNDLGSVSALARQDDNNHNMYGVNYSRSIPSDGGLGWDIGFNEYSRGETYVNGAIRMRNRSVEIQAGGYGTASTKTYWGNVSGSIIAMNQQVFMSQRVHDSFVLVSTDGIADVPVKFENNVVGYTNPQGYFLVAKVPSYYDGKYEIDPVNLPINLYADELEKRAAVKGMSGYQLNFPVKTLNMGSLTLVDEQGAFIPLGSHVMANEEESTYVGWNGEVYLEHLVTENHLVVQLPDESICTVNLTLDDAASTENDAIRQLGEQVCQARR